MKSALITTLAILFAYMLGLLTAFILFVWMDSRMPPSVVPSQPEEGHSHEHESPAEAWRPLISGDEAASIELPYFMDWPPGSEKSPFVMGGSAGTDLRLLNPPHPSGDRHSDLEPESFGDVVGLVVRGTDIYSVSHRKSTSTLVVILIDGARFDFGGVPEFVFHEMIAASSPEKYFDAKIRGKYGLIGHKVATIPRRATPLPD